MTNGRSVIHARGRQWGNARAWDTPLKSQCAQQSWVLCANAAAMECRRRGRAAKVRLRAGLKALRWSRGFLSSPSGKTGKYGMSEERSTMKKHLLNEKWGKGKPNSGFWSKIQPYTKLGYPEYERLSPQNFKGGQLSLLVHYFKSKISFHKLPNYSPDPSSHNREYILTCLTR